MLIKIQLKTPKYKLEESVALGVAAIEKLSEIGKAIKLTNRLN